MNEERKQPNHMIAPSVPHLLLQDEKGTSPIAFRLVLIALAYNRVSKKHLRRVWDLLPFLVALQTTVEMPARSREFGNSIYRSIELGTPKPFASN